MIDIVRSASPAKCRRWILEQGHGADRRHEAPQGWDDNMNVSRGAARSRLDMGHGFVRNIVSLEETPGGIDVAVLLRVYIPSE